MNTTTLTIRVPEDMYKFIEMESKRRQESKNAFINSVLQAHKVKMDDAYMNFKDEKGVTLYEYLYGESD
ncbi:hypothetical protein P7D98_22675, partial [Enterococcus avium]